MWKRRLIPTAFGLAIVAALAALRLADPYPLQVARETAFDLFQQVQPRAASDLPVRVVDIDEASLAELGQWPWPRRTLAALVTRLTELGAAAIAFDFVFPEPDRLSPARIAESLEGGVPGVADPSALPDYDAEFAAALAASPSVLGFSLAAGGTARLEEPKAGVAISGTDPRPAIPRIGAVTLPLPSLREAASGLGSFSLNAEESVTVIRRLPLLWSDGQSVFPSLAIEALRVAVGASTLVVLGETGDVPAVEAVRIGDFTVPTTPGGDLWLYYRHADPSLYVSAKDVLATDPSAVADRIAGHIVFVGTSASGLLDIRGTPLDRDVPGVSIHAQALEQMLSGAFLTRTDWVLGLELLGFAALGAAIVVVILWTGPLIGLLFAGMVGSVVLASSWFAFANYGLLIDPSFPFLGAFCVYAAMLFFQFAITDADKREIRRAFGHYVAPALLAEIERNSERLKLGGDVRPLTIMFSDVRNFTPISESLEPRALVTVLNTLFGALGVQITGQYGTIDKFMGDAIMAFWNAPVDVPGHAEKACLAALAMRRALAELNARDAFGLKAAGKPIDTIAIGVGISSGEALVGNMGLETRFDYSCVGDAVNVASRVEGACKVVGYDILVVEATRAEASGLAFLEAGSLELKGKSSREAIHILVGDVELAGSRAFLTLAAAHRALLAALRRGEDGEAELAACLALVPPVDPQLAGFYAQIAARAGDFRPEPVLLSA